MAWLEKRGNTFHVLFRFGGRRFKGSLHTGNRHEAQRLADRAERRLALIAQGDTEMPDGADLVRYVVSDGRRCEAVRLAAPLPLSELFRQYRDSLPDGSLEQSSLYTMTIHMKHLTDVLGQRFDLRTLTLDGLQSYVNRRSKAAGRHGRRLSPTTIRKEVTSLSAVWTWARQSGHLSDPFPSHGLRYPKTSSKPPFQTKGEIERTIAVGSLSAAEENELWDCLYLTRDEIDEVLSEIESHSRHPFVYPMALMAAHTGARRSELVRSNRRDFDLDAGTVTIHERKRSRTRRTTRCVPLSAKLRDVMAQWLEQSGGAATFTKAGQPIDAGQASDHLKRTLKHGPWEKIRGWHIFRHSFISNCAAQGVDQRMIDAWSGHQTDEMRRRYTHLFRDAQRTALDSVF